MYDEPDYSPDAFRRCLNAIGHIAGLTFIIIVAIVMMAVYGG